jgi:hypothetical protein
MSDNPYVVEGQEPTLQRSVFAYVDLLGYTELIKKTQGGDEKQQLQLRRLHKTLKETRYPFEPEYIKTILQEAYMQWRGKMSWALRAFSDNIAIGYPALMWQDGVFLDYVRAAFSEIVWLLSNFQFEMALQGFFMRGAMTFGQAYIDEYMVFGEALLEAHDVERCIACYPRIIVSDSLKKEIEKHGDDSPLSHELLKDADGQFFINYLQVAVPCRGEIRRDEIMGHKNVIEKMLAEHGNAPRIWEKYAWVANYHNSFCEMNSESLTNEYWIDMRLFRAKPTPIVV